MWSTLIRTYTLFFTVKQNPCTKTMVVYIKQHNILNKSNLKILFVKNSGLIRFTYTTRGFNTDRPNIYHPWQLSSNVPWISSSLQMISSSLFLCYPLHQTLINPVKPAQEKKKEKTNRWSKLTFLVQEAYTNTWINL